MMKKLMTLLFVGVFAIGTVACGQTKEETALEPETVQAVEDDVTEAPAEEETAEEKQDSPKKIASLATFDTSSCAGHYMTLHEDGNQDEIYFFVYEEGQEPDTTYVYNGMIKMVLNGEEKELYAFSFDMPDYPDYMYYGTATMDTEDEAEYVFCIDPVSTELPMLVLYNQATGELVDQFVCVQFYPVGQLEIPEE